MSYANYRIGELWGSFMPRKKEIINPLTNDLISLVVYKPSHFIDFQPTNEFERWAAVEVADFDNLPNEMETFILSSVALISINSLRFSLISLVASNSVVKFNCIV